MSKIISLLALFFITIGCAPNRTYVIQERIAASSDKLWPSIAMVVMVPIGNNPAWFGSAWAIEKDYLITAGHLCESVHEGVKLQKSKPGLSVIGSDNLGADVPIGTAEILGWVNNNFDDMCVLKLRKHGLKPLIVADDLTPVQTEDRVSINGAPRGAFPIRHDGYVWVVNPRALLLAITVRPGYSGAPVLWHDRVIGMVIAKPNGDVETGIAARSDLILKFFRKVKAQHIADELQNKSTKKRK